MEVADRPGNRIRRLSLDQGLIDRAASRLAARTGVRPTFRTLVNTAVKEELEDVVSLLLEAGLEHLAGDKPRPRAVDDAVWDVLEFAEESVAVDKVALIRCCLERLARSGQEE